MISVDQDKIILVWSFYDAPEEYRSLSPHGGDEDWLAFIPGKIAREYDVPEWMGRGFGRSETSIHRQINGDIICIGAHA